MLLLLLLLKEKWMNFVRILYFSVRNVAEKDIYSLSCEICIGERERMSE